MSVLSSLLIALAIVACDAGVVRDQPVLEYGVRNVAQEGVYKPVVGYQSNQGYVAPKSPLPAVGFGNGANGAFGQFGANPFGTAVGGLKPFGSFRSLFGGSAPLYRGDGVFATGLGQGVGSVATPVKEVADYVAPVAPKQYSGPGVFKEYVPKVALRGYTAPVAFQGYAGPVGYQGQQAGYTGAGYVPNVVPAVGYGVRGVTAQQFPSASTNRGYSGPLVIPKQQGYGAVKKIDW